MRVIIVDDHPLVRNGFEQVIRLQPDMEFVGPAENVADALTLLRNEQPDVALVDLKLGRESGLDVVIKGRALAPACRFVILTAYAGAGDVRLARSCGVDGYVLKDAMPDELLMAIRTVMTGRRYFDPGLVDAGLDLTPVRDPLATLTEREREVLAALAKGLSNREIAGQLFISENTAKKHIVNILEKLNLEDRTQAALFAAQHSAFLPDPWRH